MSAEKTSLLEFPTAFPIKIMGKAETGFAQSIVDIVLKHDPAYQVESTELRPSSAGHYVGVTCTITATSQEQLDALYREIGLHPLVSLVL